MRRVVKTEAATPAVDWVTECAMRCYDMTERPYRQYPTELIKGLHPC